jgi:hypothetical protein
MSETSSGRICEWQSAIGYAAVTFDHIALSDPTGDKPGIVVCEIPANLKRCDIRNTVLIGRASLCIFAQRENSRSTKRPLSQSLVKRFSTSAPLPKINETGEVTFQGTRHGKSSGDGGAGGSVDPT